MRPLHFTAAALTGFLIGWATSTQAMEPAQAWMEFQKQNPCPSTGQQYGRCPGWVMYYIVPPSQGGEISPYNLKWVQRPYYPETRRRRYRYDREECYYYD